MAPFRWPDDAGRLDFDLLRESPVSLYFSVEVLGEHLGWLREHQYLVHSFDCSRWASEGDFHTDVGRSLAFPNYYGRNLDAFNDCLHGIDVPEDGGTVMAFLAFDTFFSLSPDRHWHILDIIACRSRSFLLQGRRLLALVHSGDRHLGIKPVGARPVLWNSTERGRHMREQLEEARKMARPPEETRE